MPSSVFQCNRCSMDPEVSWLEDSEICPRQVYPSIPVDDVILIWGVKIFFRHVSLDLVGYWRR